MNLLAGNGITCRKWYNLVQNAVKFTKRGFVRLIAPGIQVSQNTYFLSIKVEDSGVGIPEEQFESIFFKYQQIDLRTEVGASGMGLAIAKRLAQMMGEDIKVSSVVNQGSTFTFELSVEAPI